LLRHSARRLLMPLLFGVLAVVGLVALANRKPAPLERVVDPTAALVAEMRVLYARIGAVLGWQLPPLVFTTAIANAASDGRNILVNLPWVRAMLDKHCNEPACAVAAIVGLLVHELTHHVYRDALIPAASWEEQRARERRADHNAGYVVASLGLDPAHLERVLGDPEFCCDLAHDPPWQRVLVVREGASIAWSAAA